MAGFRRLFRLTGREPEPGEDIATEFEAHLQLKADALARLGLCAEEARREAERLFGPRERFASECRAIDHAERRERHRREWWSGFWQDLRLAARGLRRAPGFALTGILVLAAGIGLNATVFSVLRGVVLRGLPYPQADRLVAVYSSNPKAGWPTFAVSPADLYDWQREAKSFDALVGWQENYLAATGEGPAEQVRIFAVSDGFRQVTGIAPALGRSFTTAEFATGAPLVVLLSHDTWVNRFGGDRKVLGRRWMLDGDSYEIVGVMPVGFGFPNGKMAGWVPFQVPKNFAQQRGAHYLDVTGRLAGAVTLERATSELVTLADRIARTYPRSSAGWSVALKPLHEALVGAVRPTLLLLMAGGGLLLLLACANVGNLVLVRAIGKSGEAALRSALGAGRARLLWHAASEVLVLTLIGALAALPVALAGTALIRRLAPPGVPRLDEVALDPVVALFTLGITLLTALLLGVAPARRLRHTELRPAIAGAGGRSTNRTGLHRWLVSLETALALGLLAVAGVLLKSKQRLESVHPGFDASTTLIADLSLPERRYPDAGAIDRFQTSLLEGLRAIPGVRSTAVVFGLPLSGFAWSSSFTIDSVPVPDGVSQSMQLREVSQDYFATVRMPILQGRGFSPDDRYGNRKVLVVSAAAVRRFWPDGKVLGHYVRMGARPGPGDDRVEGEIVGVVADVHDRGLDADAWPIAYADVAQVPVGYLTVLLRADRAPLALAPELRRVVAALDPELPVSQLRSFDSVVRDATASPRFRAWLMGCFALLATALGGLGVYSVISHLVAQRSREMGLRRALGATEHQVVTQVVGAAMRDAAVGAAAGVALGWLITRQLVKLLFEVKPGDPLVLAASAALFLTIALLGSWIPARRAARADPVAVLRGE
jgi:putative ABC transport system permease protein